MNPPINPQDSITFMGFCLYFLIINKAVKKSTKDIELKSFKFFENPFSPHIDKINMLNPALAIKATEAGFKPSKIALIMLNFLYLK